MKKLLLIFTITLFAFPSLALTPEQVSQQQMVIQQQEQARQAEEQRLELRETERIRDTREAAGALDDDTAANAGGDAVQWLATKATGNENWLDNNYLTRDAFNMGVLVYSIASTAGNLMKSGPGIYGNTSSPSVAGSVASKVDDVAKSAPNFIVDSSGQIFPVPKSATGPVPVISRTSGQQTGVAFTGGSGGTNKQVNTIRLMNPTPARGNAPAYPQGYATYQNSAKPTSQAVNPYTGQTGSRTGTHFPINPSK